MQKVLIISPYFPPSNAADMQRIRMSLPYFQEFDWEAEIMTVSPEHSQIPKDSLLLRSIPAGTQVHIVNALSLKWTSKLGLGSIALRSMWYYKNSVNKLLETRNYDLIYFSTTQFPLCILGAYWKKKFGIPYVIDMQDPWHSEYYRNKPKAEQPRKYWMSYRLHKFLEPIAMRSVDGLISVSEDYITTLKQRYRETKHIPAETITFGASDIDQKIVAEQSLSTPAFLSKKNNVYNLVYVGRGGKDMQKALRKLFTAFNMGLNTDAELFSKFKMHFIGTSYAPSGQGERSISPLADEYALKDRVFEMTDRIPFYEGLATLQWAEGLIVPGSDDPRYTASKIYPYIMAKKPLLAIFHPNSSVVDVVRQCNAGQLVTFDDSADQTFLVLKQFLESISEGLKPSVNWEAFEKYTDREMTKRQVELFNRVINAGTEKNIQFHQ